MRKRAVGLMVLLLSAAAAGAAEPDVILRAQHDAAEDGRHYRPFLWGVGGAAVTAVPVVVAAFFADSLPVEARRGIALTAPVAAGASLALVGYCTGRASVPDARIAAVQNEYHDADLLALYEAEYRRVLSQIQRRKRGNAALIGFGASVSITGAGFLVVYLTK
jgi:hypothetical protein